ncbi:MAG: fatty acid desaturase [Synechococcales cyanobacterium T60_A2020_003]|nr:fatty acid desaturase [Synechococcales cyanobacterium T60_A2020_003]
MFYGWTKGLISSQSQSEHRKLADSPVHSTAPHLGLVIASLIIAVWGMSLKELLVIDLSLIRLPILVLFIGWQTFLYTGLFVTAHDAMHGAISPGHSKIDTYFGTLALLLYGLLPYQKLCRIHSLHHCYPASLLDPDFHGDKHRHVVLWYLGFIYSHGSAWSSCGLAVLYLIAHGVFQIEHMNLILFWISPSLLSSFQLFYFGTFQPHREPPEGYTNTFRTKTIARPFLWSLLSCYHFGYHYEHHRYPDAPWWLLPSLRPRCSQ